MKHHSTWTQQRQPDGTMTWRSPTGHTYTDPPREITLPGELLTPTPTPRTTIGLADTEHRQPLHHNTPGTSPTDKAADNAEQDTRTRSYAIRLADREDTHQRVLHRLANLRHLQNTADDNQTSQHPSHHHEPLDRQTRPQQPGLPTTRATTTGTTTTSTTTTSTTTTSTTRPARPPSTTAETSTTSTPKTTPPGPSPTSPPPSPNSAPAADSPPPPPTTTHHPSDERNRCDRAQPTDRDAAIVPWLRNVRCVRFRRFVAKSTNLAPP